MIFSVISFSLMDISVKLMSSNYPIGQLVFFRGFLGLIPIFFIIPLNRYKNLLVTTKLKLHVGRAVAGTFAMVNLYLGLKFLPIADAITISFAAPIFATIFSIFCEVKVIDRVCGRPHGAPRTATRRQLLGGLGAHRLGRGAVFQQGFIPFYKF